MPVFRVHLDAPDGSGHFRRTSVEAGDKDEARRIVERLELRRTLFELNAGQQAELCATYGVESIDELPKAAPRDAADEERAAFRSLAPRTRAWLHTHYQSAPYKITKIEEAS